MIEKESREASVAAPAGGGAYADLPGDGPPRRRRRGADLPGDGPARGRRLWWAVGVAALVVLAALGWLGVRGVIAGRHLAAARDQVLALERDVLTGKVPRGAAMTARVRRIQGETRAARALTHDPVWSVAAALPGAGCPARTARSVSALADTLSTAALPSLASAADALDLANLRRGRTVLLGPLVRSRPALAVAADRLAAAVPTASAVGGCGWLGGFTGAHTARTQLVLRTTELAGRAASARAAAGLLPPMLGAGGPRRYLLVVQNDAESRATGGIIGGYGLLTASNGTLTLGPVRGNDSLPYAAEQPGLVDLGADFSTRYGPFDADHNWGNADLTPDFPSAAKVWAALYRRGTGTRVDGVLAIDPTALSYVVGASGPAVLPDDTVVRADRLVPLLESQVYATITDPAARDAYFAAVGEATYQAAVRAVDTVGLVQALGRSAGEGRLQVWSARPAEEAQLVATPLGGALPTARGPFLAVVTQNAAASKLDYWLTRSTSYAMGAGGEATVTVTLHNGAPAGLPAYVRQRQDLADRSNPQAATKLWVSVYAGVGAGFRSATLDGRPVDLAVTRERGHPVFSLYATVAAGRTATLVVHVHEPVAGPVLSVRRQPLVRQEKIDVTGIRWQALPGATLPG